MRFFARPARANRDRSAICLGRLPEDASRRAFARLYLKRPARDDDFWELVAARPEFRRDDAEKIRHALELGELTAGHLPLVRELQRRMDRDPRSFVAYDVEEWARTIDAVDPPDDQPGATRGAKVESHAQALERAFEARYFPTMLASRIHQGAFAMPDGIRSDVQRFLNRNPDFEFGRRSVAVVLADRGGAELEGILTLAGSATS
jgi:hypothetical protein